MAIPRKGLAIVGVIVGVVVSKGSTSSSSTGDGTSGSTSSSAAAATSSSGGTTKSSSSTKKTSTGSNSSATTITSDPTSVKYSLAAFAIGDWGTTTTKSSCFKRSSTYNDDDVNAEDIVASVMNQQAAAAEVAPKCVIGHGNNFYWNGIDSANGRDSRFTTTFEGKFDDDNIKTLPWVNVLGNHDYGGADYICSDGDSAGKCSSADDLLTSLKNKFSWQSTYTSPNDNRWVLEDHFYVYSIQDEASGVSIDIFNVDSGDADSHGATETCCQCYGYAGDDDKKCANVARGDDACCGGDGAMFDKCMAQFTAWSDDSRKQLEANIANSTATWKVVNSHYSPYAHYDQAGMENWLKIINGTGIHLWLNGHTHGESHDYSSSVGVHFVDSGAGGGIQKESAAGIPTYAKDLAQNLWVHDGQEYGFFSLTASKDWLKLQDHTADDKWSYAESFNSTTIGGVATTHAGTCQTTAPRARSALPRRPPRPPLQLQYM
ncbi:Tartrate-resistant acid phosphatase type 5 [Phytophthora cinnamomi]|uniref:Tartrate-resistant acid phosphatase type 5 n=1 Tax=Phytophthora cinnamomi TaxID=4785 RepID=UPI003559A9D4|nr:Tartrate-resistant acid phosphatase type 5 [Phytophthora cinnamomi]